MSAPQCEAPPQPPRSEQENVNVQLRLIDGVERGQKRIDALFAVLSEAERLGRPQPEINALWRNIDGAIEDRNLAVDRFLRYSRLYQWETVRPPTEKVILADLGRLALTIELVRQGADICPKGERTTE